MTSWQSDPPTGSSRRPAAAERVAPGAGSLAACAVVVGALALAGGLLAGPRAALAAAVGGVLTVASQVLLVGGLRRLLGRAAQAGAAGRARSTAVAGFVGRHAVAATLLFVAIVRLDLPMGWLLAGLTASPAVLVAWACRQQALPARAGGLTDPGSLDGC